MMGAFVQVNDLSRHAKAHPVGYVICENGCWEWVGSIHRLGYGFLYSEGRNQIAHRVIYKRFKGPIPLGLELDHLCRNRKCVNPDHLEPVTHRENVLRGNGIAAQEHRRTCCSKCGKELAGDNLLPEQLKRGQRGCRACRAIHRRTYYLKVKAKRANSHSTPNPHD